MDPEIEKILNEKYLMLIVKKDGQYLIDHLTFDQRDKEIEIEINKSPDYSVIGFGPDHLDESIILSYGKNYKVHKNTKDQKDFMCQNNFLIKNKEQHNYIATCIANHLDDTYINCIIGNCAFVVNDSTIITKTKLENLIEKFKIK